MSLALSLAVKGRYSTAPNPQVGCVIVKDDQLIASAYHQKAGDSHAEVLALKEAGDQARGADLYVTLEPCSHRGKTPPCVGSIIKSGISRVFIATIDPNPKVNGQGVSALRSAGIEVNIGIAQQEATFLNRPFFHLMQSSHPFVTAKWAMTLDGKMAVRTNEQHWISGEKSRQSVHDLRAQMCCILIGRRTAAIDHPSLNVRFIPEGSPYSLFEDIRQPRPIIITTSGDIPLSCPLLAPFQKTLVFASRDADEKWIRELEKRRIEVEWCEKEGTNRLNLHQILESLGRRSYMHLLVEGGSQVLGHFWRTKKINRIAAYISPKIMGKEGVFPIEGGKDTPLTLGKSLKNCHVSLLGEDVLVMGDVNENEREREECLVGL